MNGRNARLRQSTADVVDGDAEAERANPLDLGEQLGGS